MTNLHQSLRKWYNMQRHGEVALVKHEGYSYLLAKNNRFDMKLMCGKDWERGLRDRAVEEINRHDIDLFIDVGANLGLYTIDISKRSAARETIAFEPLPNNFNQLCGNIFANGLSDRVTAVRGALSDHDGTAAINIDTDFTIHSTLESFGTNNAKFDKSITVPLIRFDDHYPIQGRRIFLKIDVEGHEIKTLNGMTELLANNKMSLQIEVGDENLPAVSELLTGLGYRQTGDLLVDRFYSNM